MLNLRCGWPYTRINYKLFYLCSVASISCYQCNSTDIEDQFRCNEFMDTYGLEPQPCTDVYNAAYCVKLSGRYEGVLWSWMLASLVELCSCNFNFLAGGLGVKRYCSSHDLGNYCNYVKQPGDKMEYRTCVYTCDSDGCNGSNQVKLFGYLIGVSLFPLFRWLLF